jgi:type VI secretion system protein ImpF
MSRVGSQQPLTPSLLDRLIDLEPDVSTEPAWRQAQNLREYEAGVLRDVENLLNTRPVFLRIPTEQSELAKSVLTFGMPDFISTGVGSIDEREQLRRNVETTIQRFEPRLREVRVELHQLENAFDRTLRMTIHALLWVEPEPQPIAFDTVVQPSSGTCKVESA